MRLLQKLGMTAALMVGITLSAQAAIEDTLSYYDTDDYGNVVYFGSGPSSEYEFLFVDGSDTVGMFASASIPTIYRNKQAGYAVIPANDFEQMSRNAQFAKTYSVDCQRERIKDDTGEIMRLSNASAFHQTAAGMVCSVLE